MFKLRI